MIKLRPYQQQAIEAMRQHASGICVAPAGSGKTVIAAALVMDIISSAGYDRRPNVLWIAHTKEQVDQAKVALYDAGCMQKAHCIASCYAGNPDMTWADIVLIDECHHAGSESVRKQVEIAKLYAVFVYGFTATPKREDGVDITEIIGPILYTVARDEIQAVGGVVPAEVRVVDFGKTGELDAAVCELAQTHYTRGMRWHDTKTGTQDQLKRCEYRAAVTLGVTENPARDALIAYIANTHAGLGDSVIVLVGTKAHGKALESMIDGAVFVSSGVSKRSRKIDDFKTGKTAVLIATSLLNEGADVPIASVLVLAGCGKSYNEKVQQTGRVLRPYSGKACGLIYDIKDNGHGMLTAQHWARRRIYKGLGYRVGGA